MAGLKHPHKYHKIDLIGQKLFACALPNCTHYMPAHLMNMIVGKNSICWGCGKIFVMDESHLEQEKPICFNCSKGLPSDENELENLLKLIAEHKKAVNQQKENKS